MSKLAHSNQETMDQIERDAENHREPPSWYCEPCAVEVYALHCQHCGKTKRERR
jgi:hypothetical protein